MVITRPILAIKIATPTTNANCRMIFVGRLVGQTSLMKLGGIDIDPEKSVLIPLGMESEI